MSRTCHVYQVIVELEHVIRYGHFVGHHRLLETKVESDQVVGHCAPGMTQHQVQSSPGNQPQRASGIWVSTMITKYTIEKLIMNNGQSPRGGHRKTDVRTQPHACCRSFLRQPPIDAGNRVTDMTGTCGGGFSGDLW